MTADLTHVRPLVDPAGLDDGLPLAGGPLRFGRAVLTGRDGARHVVPAAALAGAIGPAALDRLTAPRAPLPGLAGDGPHVMGILNVTPDSFSDGGIDRDAAAAVARGLAMAAAGADIVDVGGESTRPGATPVTPEEELARVLPVVRGLCAAGVAVSIDSRHARVQAAAVEAGACLINDVSGLAHDPDSLRVAAASGRPVAVMHMRGTPATMQGLAHYRDVAAEVHDELAARLDACAAAGLPPERIVLDPGLGFAKTAQHNVALLRDLAMLHGLGCRLLVGASRKSFIARLSRDEPPDRRLAGSLAAAQAALDAGAQMLRVHDVAETVQAVALWRALRDVA